MSVQIAAHGFDLTDGLRECCQNEVKDRLSLLAHHNDFSAKWILSLENSDHVAHLHWSDGKFHGDVTVKSEDMYSSIHQASKKAAEQLKRAHERAYDHQAQRSARSADKAIPE